MLLHVPLAPQAPEPNSSRMHPCMCPCMSPEPNSSRMCPCMCPWLRRLRSQIPPGCTTACAPACALACAPGPAGSGAKFLQDVPLHVPLAPYVGFGAEFLQDAPLHVPLHVPLAPRAPEPNSSGMRPFMCPCTCPWLRGLWSQIPPGCALACAPGAKFLQDASLHVPLHVPLALRSPEPNSSRMGPFMYPCMCPWLRGLQSQTPPGCAPSCAPGSASSGARFLQDVPLHVPRRAPTEPGLIAPRYARLMTLMTLKLLLRPLT